MSVTCVCSIRNIVATIHRNASDDTVHFLLATRTHPQTLRCQTQCLLPFITRRWPCCDECESVSVVRLSWLLVVTVVVAVFLHRNILHVFETIKQNGDSIIDIRMIELNCWREKGRTRCLFTKQQQQQQQNSIKQLLVNVCSNTFEMSQSLSLVVLSSSALAWAYSHSEMWNLNIKPC